MKKLVDKFFDVENETTGSKSFCNDGLSCPDCKKEYSRTHLEKQFAGRRKDYEWVISYLCDCGATLSIIRQPATYKIAVAT